MKKETAVAISREAKIINVVMPDAKMEPAGRINYFHRVTKEAGKLSIAAAFYAGLELMRVKKNLVGHGEFQKWVESNCDFAYSTGHNYIHVAYMCLDKAGYECDELLDGSDTTRVKAVEDAAEKCESDSLNEIYIELGIVKKSKSNMGGKREGAGRKRKDDAEALAREAEEIAGKAGALEISKTVGDLFVLAVSQDLFGSVGTVELKEQIETLEQVLKRAKEIVKSRKGK